MTLLFAFRKVVTGCGSLETIVTLSLSYAERNWANRDFSFFVHPCLWCWLTGGYTDIHLIPFSFPLPPNPLNPSGFQMEWVNI
jgi:hypothetical protein